MDHFPRGIAPELLLSQVKNTMPYLFCFPDSSSGVRLADLGGSDGNAQLSEKFVPAQVLRAFDTDAGQVLDHFEYFRLCLCSHYLTCATLVPTDVDNQIRKKLWHPKLSLELVLQMAQLVLESRRWDFTQVSSRFTYGRSEWEKESLGGHHGEWFTVASAAYCALGHYADSAAQEKRQQLFAEIADEVRRHSEIFGSLWRANDGIGCLRTSANITHNLGDLDRVMDMWDLSVADPLRLEFYKLGAMPFDSNRNLRYLGRLWVAGELYKSNIENSSMALENHRHFALRKPRCLRQSRVFLIPNGPFFDDWGRTVARGLASPEGKPSENTREVVGALLYGWSRLPKTIGYGRALRGILEVHPDLTEEILKVAPRSLDDRSARTRERYSEEERSQESFEKKWAELALIQMDEIPSRA